MAPLRTSLAVVIAILCSSCGSIERPPTVIEDGTYTSERITRGGQPVTLLPGTQVVIKVEGSFLRASAGCNRMVGPYAVDEGGRLVLLEETGMTILACPPEGTRDEQRAYWNQDMWLRGVLSSRPMIRLDGRVLTIVAGPTFIELRPGTSDSI